jgi:hypothetical protein
LARIAVEDVRGDPEGAAHQALDLVATRSDRYAIHLDVDVVDFTDAPLSDHPSRNTGLKLDQMLRALKILTSGPDSWRSRSPSSIPITQRPTTDCSSASRQPSPTRSAPISAATQPEAAEVPKQPDEPPRVGPSRARKDAG